MQALHFQFLRDAHHVAGKVHISTVAQVQLVEEGGLAAAVVAAGRGTPVLRARPTGRIVIPDAFPHVLAGHLVHLFLEQDLVQIVHFFVCPAVIIDSIGMLVNGTGRIHLETFHTIVQEGFQVIHPVLLARLRPAFARRNLILFGNAKVILLAKPQAQMEAHVAQFSNEKTVVQLLGILVLQPVGFRGEFIKIPTLGRREIVSFLHPLRFQPEYVAGNLQLTEEDGIVQDIPLILTHVRTEAQAIGPLGKHVIAPRHTSIEAQDILHRGTAQKVEIGLVKGIEDVEYVFFGIADIEEILAGGIVEDTPAPAAHHERHRNFRMLVGGPHAQQLSAVLDMLATRAAASVETFFLPQREPEEAGIGRFAALGIVLLFFLIGIIADDAIVFHHMKIGILVIDYLGQRGDFPVLSGHEFHAFHHRLSIGRQHTDIPGLFVQDQFVGRRRQGPGAPVRAYLFLHGLPVGGQQAVPFHQGLRKIGTGRYLYPENPIRASFHAHRESIGQLYLMCRTGQSGPTRQQGGNQEF